VSKKPSILTIVVLIVASAACSRAANDETAASSSQTAMTEEDKTLYALGLMLGGNLKQFQLTPEELKTVQRGLRDAATGAKAEVELTAYGPKVQELVQKRTAASAEHAKKDAVAFEEAAAKEAGAVRLQSGLIYTQLKAGDGAQPAADSVVKVHYEGRLTDGSVFDSSIRRGAPLEFSLRGVIPCWTEGLQRMKVGGKAKLVCPSAIAYGDRGHPPVIPGGATLVFEVELLEVKAAPEAPKGR
jgi:FKBP-type peptidyl-prolyl cis-trans isomerase FkpA